MKKIRWYAWAAMLGVAMLLVEVYAHAGLRAQPVVGAAVASQARLQAPLRHTYLVAGAHALQWTPFMRDPAMRLAESVWGDAFVPIREHPELALYELGDASHGVVHALLAPMYWGAPLFLLLAAIGYALRPRRVHVMGSGNH
ncbi:MULTISPECIES: hypothetical protein [Oleiagrimonas]|jgi:hypothetical protein|uniref:Uncharacterized protein n=1 Tax=Oleiagrimonas citrea TaxID=1665687 RepID=A0A846ZNX2_9GAMM|nr:MULTISPECIES: hypothetical protein [Oleiagrimonas]NKZ39726.1 hypothetical protein [Oleiagrimonas citrea]RAP59321.1 hypothetical protein BTJ49_01220 [Oleiagrimonas sp. MCCC 1A03011]